MSSGTRAKVPDASVLAAWAFGESRAREAEKLMLNSTLHAPRLLIFELANLAREKIRSGPQDRDRVTAGLRAAEMVEIEYLDPDPQILVQLALERDLSVYDAAYVWVAGVLEAQLLTFDSRLRIQPETRALR